MTPTRIRPAREDEIAALVDIDGDAARLFQAAGLDVGDGDESYALAERARWTAAVGDGRAAVAVTGDDTPVAFAVFGTVDGEPYLDEVAVRCAWMRQGIGRRLVERAIAWASASGGSRLWLTTYAHLPWNRPFYERAGFAVRDEAACGRELREVLRQQRAALPCPEERIAMVRGVGPGSAPARRR